MSLPWTQIDEEEEVSALEKLLSYDGEERILQKLGFERAIKRLSKMESLCLTAKFDVGMPETLIAAVFDLTQPRISQIISSGLDKFRVCLGVDLPAKKRRKTKGTKRRNHGHKRSDR